jgi:alpha-ribazole phosphatase
MRLVLLRHTRTAAPAGTCYGQSDVALAEPHDPPFEQVQAWLQAAGLAPDRLVASPLRRCRELAQHLARALGLSLRLDGRWMELGFGDWEGRPWPAIDRRQSDPWAADPWHRAPPGGETLAALTQRVHAAMDEPADEGGCALVVCHAGPMRVALARARGLPTGQHPEQALPFGGVVQLQGRRRAGAWHWTEHHA